MSKKKSFRGLCRVNRLILAGSERVKDCVIKTNWKQCSLIPGAHPPHALFSVILCKSGRTYFTENFGYTIVKSQ